MYCVRSVPYNLDKLKVCFNMSVRKIVQTKNLFQAHQKWFQVCFSLFSSFTLTSYITEPRSKKAHNANEISDEL